LKDILEQERIIDREIIEEIERYQIEREMGNLDLMAYGGAGAQSDDSDQNMRFPEESSLDQLP
jgi:hypothetical protein